MCPPNTGPTMGRRRPVVRGARLLPFLVLTLSLSTYGSTEEDAAGSCDDDAAVASKRRQLAERFQCDAETSVLPCALPMLQQERGAAPPEPPPPPVVPLFRASASKGERLLLAFAHVPKTGGTTFAHVLSKVCEAANGTTCSIQQRKELAATFADNMPWPPSEADAVGSIHAVHGHWVRLGNEEIAREAARVNATHVVKVVMARHPVQRMLSEYLQTPVPFQQWWMSNKGKLQDLTARYAGPAKMLPPPEGTSGVPFRRSGLSQGTTNTLVLLTEAFQDSMRLLDAVLGFDETAGGGEEKAAEGGRAPPAAAAAAATAAAAAAAGAATAAAASFAANHGGRAWRCFDAKNRATGIKSYHAWARRSATDGRVLNGECGGGGAPAAEHDLAAYAPDAALRSEVHRTLRAEIQAFETLRTLHCCQMRRAGLEPSSPAGLGENICSSELCGAL